MVNVPPPAAARFAVNVDKSNVPLVTERSAASVMAAPRVTVFAVLLTCSVLNAVDDEPPRLCAPEPSKVTVPDPAAKAPPFFAQLPASVIDVPAVRVPPLSVPVPLMSNVAGAVKVPSVIVRLFVVIRLVLPPVERVPPDLLTARLLNV